MELKEKLYQKLLHRGQQLIAMTPENQDNSTEQDLHNLQDKWECVQAKVAERKVSAVFKIKIIQQLDALDPTKQTVKSVIT